MEGADWCLLVGHVDMLGEVTGETLGKIENIRQMQNLFRLTLWINFQLNQFAESAHLAVVWWHEPRGWDSASLDLDCRLRSRVYHLCCLMLCSGSSTVTVIKNIKDSHNYNCLLLLLIKISAACKGC